METSAPSPAPTPTPRRRWPRRLAWTVAAAVALLLAAVAGLLGFAWYGEPALPFAAEGSRGTD